MIEPEYITAEKAAYNVKWSALHFRSLMKTIEEVSHFGYEWVSCGDLAEIQKEKLISLGFTLTETESDDEFKIKRTKISWQL